MQSQRHGEVVVWTWVLIAMKGWQVYLARPNLRTIKLCWALSWGIIYGLCVQPGWTRKGLEGLKGGAGGLRQVRRCTGIGVRKVLAKLQYWSLKFILCAQLVPQVWSVCNWSLKFLKWAIWVLLLTAINGVTYVANGAMTWHFILMMWHIFN